MTRLPKKWIRTQVADSQRIYGRGLEIYRHGSYFLSDKTEDKTQFTYCVDGNYGQYETRVILGKQKVSYACTCPYPGAGCKHVVAALLKTGDLLSDKNVSLESKIDTACVYLTPEEIKTQALADRKKRAAAEAFTLVRGDMLKGDHRVVSKNNRKYRVTLHSPQEGIGHCNCPDYMTAGLGTCKHIIYLVTRLKKENGFKKKLAEEQFVFFDIFWDSLIQGPRMFAETRLHPDLWAVLAKCFNDQGEYICKDYAPLLDLVEQLDGDKRVRIRESLLKRLGIEMEQRQLGAMAKEPVPDPDLSASLYPYQKEGVAFGLFKSGVLIGDEMGLGKTVQAIALGVLKKDVFGFSKVLIVTLASLKEQWKREIEKFSHESALVVSGTPEQRQAGYFNDTSLFKITNYEAVLRDVTLLSRFGPDLIILDEAQRIKNFSTKTADAVKRIPKRHAIVLTGTPLENKLEDVYSIVQFLDPYKLTPLWQFAADHFLIPAKKKSSVSGYKNLDQLKNRLSDIVIRRKKEEVLKDLPDQVVNNYYLDLTDEQAEMHAGYARSLLPLLNKKFLTPVDMQRIQALLLRMRQVCDATYLIDRESHISPKLIELSGIIDEIVVQNRRKMVIFSEWTSMTFLIARHLSEAGIHFVELSGQVPVKKRQALIDEFDTNPDCLVFLSTDAGGTGLNLQAADCVVNFELPWNPAKLNQRIGRVSRIGQKSQCINVINLISRNSIEERILAGIQLKTELFNGVFEQGPDQVEFSREKKNEMLNRLRQMMGEDAAPELPESEPVLQEEIPEDLPYYLNPKVLGPESGINESGKDPQEDLPAAVAASKDVRSERAGAAPSVEQKAQAADILAAQPPEKIEGVLNYGMQFVSGLLEMATGEKIQTQKGEDKLVSIDKDTGEVTMKFKLPGF